jgi:hypothetical protein
MVKTVTNNDTQAGSCYFDLCNGFFDTTSQHTILRRREPEDGHEKVAVLDKL